MANGGSGVPEALADADDGRFSVRAGLLHRAPEADGVLEWCRQRQVPFLA